MITRRAFEVKRLVVIEGGFLNYGSVRYLGRCQTIVPLIFLAKDSCLWYLCWLARANPDLFA